MKNKHKLYVLYVICILQMITIMLYNYKNTMAIMGTIFLMIVVSMFALRDNTKE